MKITGSSYECERNPLSDFLKQSFVCRYDFQVFGLEVKDL